jgi:type IV pilus assembly protein PilC
MALFFENLAVLVGSGFAIGDSLRRASVYSSPEVQYICFAAAPQIERGQPLSRALAPWAHRLPALVIPVLEVGEASGTLDSSSQRLADAFNQGAAIDRKIRFSAFDPKIVIGVLALSTAAHGLFSSIQEMVTTIVTTFIRLLVVYYVGRIVLRVLFQWKALRLAVDTVKLALPDIGATLRLLAGARWARSFATLWSCGVPVSSALEISSRSALNAHYEQAILKAARETRYGRSLSVSLAGTQLLPANLVQIIAIGEESGSLGSTLDMFVNGMEDEAFHRASKQFTMILAAGEVILLVLAVAAIGRV